MQNIINKSLVNNVVNIKSEILFREAEDDFYYFNHLKKAMKKLKKAVELTPNHFKSIMLYGDICFLNGYIKKALSLYLEAEKIHPKDTKVLASIANCHFCLAEYSDSILYCDKAISISEGNNNSLLSQIIEIKINSLIMQKKYKQAYKTFKQSKSIFESTSLKTICSSNFEILNEKIKLQEKLHYSGLKIV